MKTLSKQDKTKKGILLEVLWRWCSGKGSEDASINYKDAPDIADDILLELSALEQEEIPYKVNQDIRKVLQSVALHGYDLVSAESDIIEIIKRLNESK